MSLKKMQMLLRCYILVFFAMAVSRSIDGIYEQNFGKLNLTDGISCGFFCAKVPFSRPFQNKTTVKVFASLSHENNPGFSNEPTVVMVNSLSRNAFNACIMQPGHTSRNITLHWFAFSTLTARDLPFGIQSGDVSYKTFTSGSSCRLVTFPKTFSSPPKILLAARQSENAQRKDAMALWAKNVATNQFTVCLRETTNFSGKHKNIHVDWVAFLKPLSANMRELGSAFFPNYFLSSIKDIHTHCQVKHYAQRFYSPPVIILSVQHPRNWITSATDDGLIAWVKDVNVTSFEVCSMDSHHLNRKHGPIKVDYAVVGDLDPCIGVKCYKFSVCQAFGPYDARCVCVKNCPVIKQHVCASNGRSFDNRCLYQLEVCQTAANYTYFHPGRCRDYPMVRGRRAIPQSSLWPASHCQTINFMPLTFYPDKPVHVQVSVSHVNSSRVHDSVVSWVENTGYEQFTVCVMESGRNEGPPPGLATVEWMAYQGAPRGGASGRIAIGKWWTGTRCERVDISSNNFSSTPTVLVTAEHHRRSLKHDAASLWLEDVSRTSFKVCLRELQNFDGAHQDISVNWLAFSVLNRPLFSEHDYIYFPKTTQTPLAITNYAECKNVSFSSNYSSPPTVLVSPKHSSSGGNLNSEYNAITAWTESITTSRFETCFKEFFVNQAYDPVTLTFVLLKDICEPGWVYHKGFCYKKFTECQTWSRASATCLANGSNQVDLNNVEEDVFVQHLHQGNESWIGLNDRATAGVFLWPTGKQVTYTRWSPHASLSTTKAKCVYTLGRNNSYYWKLSSCKECRSFTCKKVYNVCKMQSCDSNADCINAIGSPTCQCRTGFTGNGIKCTVINCGDPGRPYYGYRSGSSFTYGSRVTFSCRSYYRIRGSSYATCQANSRWSNPTPTCNYYSRYYGRYYG